MPCGRMRNEIIGQFLCNLRREEASVRIGQLVELLVHGRQHVRMGVAETRHGRAGGGIDVFLTGTIADDDAAGSWRRLDRNDQFGDEGCGP